MYCATRVGGSFQPSAFLASRAQIADCLRSRSGGGLTGRWSFPYEHARGFRVFLKDTCPPPRPGIMKYCISSLLTAAILILPERAAALAVIALTENNEV